MKPQKPRFALNHICAPSLDIGHFLDLAAALRCEGIEIRNDLAGNAILDGTPPEAVRHAAERRGLAIFSINALQRFNEWSGEREAEARFLAGYAKECGAAALVLVPTNDGSGRADGERQSNLREALEHLRPVLRGAGVRGLVEPLGFETCSLRLKSEAAEAIRSLDAADAFGLVHDTFHHHLAGEAALFPELTRLVHISGVADRAVPLGGMRDAHRVLVGPEDRLDNVGQIAALRAAGYGGPLSFEPFSPSVQGLADPAGALSRSMDFIRGGLA